MYCPECGNRLEEDELFCPECGTKVIMERAAPLSSFGSSTNENGMQEIMNTTESPVLVRGFILTNIKGLSKRLNIDVLTIRGVLEDYITGMRNFGVQYTLLDASDYTYQTKSLFGSAKHVSLGTGDPWYAYADILKDRHDAEVREAREMESEYLFIIGGEKEVPMPCIRNFKQDLNDKTIDTDLLYAYPYGPEMAEKLQNQDLFKYDALFYVGRLPIAQDGSIDDLRWYLQNVLDNECSIPLGTAYVQCDPHWQEVTATIVQEISKYGLIPNYPSDIPAECMSKDKIFLTPYVVCQSDTHSFFQREATYYFFNMHGSEARKEFYFYGKGMNNEGFPPGMSPALINQARHPNLVFTQACYGGRFINYRKCESMMLTALTSQTLSYVGSSRIALGAADGMGSLMASDVLGLVYNCCMLSGLTAGAAFFQARIATFKSSPGHPDTALTITEFNLFGDPLVHLRLNDQAVDYTSDKHAILSKDAQVGPVRTEVLMQKSAREQSLLCQVRQAVDSNIMAISSTIAKTLYAQYGVEAREPSVISRYCYADGHKELNFVYSQPAPDGIHDEVHVQTNERGDILQLSTTK